MGYTNYRHTIFVDKTTFSCYNGDNIKPYRKGDNTMNDQEIRAKAYQNLQTALADQYKQPSLKKYKSIVEKLKKVTVDDIEVLPEIKANNAGLMKCKAKIFTRTKFSNGSLGSPYMMDGTMEYLSPKTHILSEGIDAVDAKLLRTCSVKTYSTLTDPKDRDLNDALSEEIEKHYKSLNYRELYNNPAEVSAVLLEVEPQMMSDKLKYRPIIAKISDQNGTPINFVIDMYDTERKITYMSDTHIDFLGFYSEISSPVVFDNNRNLLQWKKGLFGYKLI